MSMGQFSLNINEKDLAKISAKTDKNESRDLSSLVNEKDLNMKLENMKLILT